MRVVGRRGWTRARTTTATSRERSPRRAPTSSTSAAARRATPCASGVTCTPRCPSARLMGSDRLLVPDFYGHLGGARRAHLPHLRHPGPEPAAGHAGSASCATTGASSARSPTPTPPTVTRRCRCCSTRSGARATTREQARRDRDELLSTRGLRQRDRHVLDRRQRRHEPGRGRRLPRARRTACRSSRPAGSGGARRRRLRHAGLADRAAAGRPLAADDCLRGAASSATAAGDRRRRRRG